MSGHSKWHSIRHKKGANDAARGKIFTKHANLITIAARSGGDPDSNPALRLAIENAKAENTPNKNIERAIKKGTGEDKSAAQLMELTYEGYGPSGVAILVETLTDNRNRTVTGVRLAFTKNNGNMGESGSVAWMFNRKGILEIENISDEKAEDLEMLAIENDAEDVIIENGDCEIICDSKNVFILQKIFQDAGYEVKAKIAMHPENTVDITSEKDAENLLNLINALEDHDDISAVYSNANISREIIEKM